MKIINTEDLKKIVENLDKKYKLGDKEAFAELKTDANGRPYLSTNSWFQGEGLVRMDDTNAESVAETLGLDSDSYWEWCTSDNGNPTLCSFESFEEKQTWANQN